jgi:hypothetical protein
MYALSIKSVVIHPFIGFTNLQSWVVSRMVDDKKIMILDVDGTLRSGEHRLGLLPSQEELLSLGDSEQNQAFDKFNDACGGDTEIVGITSFIRTIQDNYHVIVLTSCTYSPHRLDVLLDQLESYSINPVMIFMRGKENNTHNPQFKYNFIREAGFFGRNPQDILAVDDCPKTVNMFRELGITALQVEDYSRFNK